MDRKVLQSMIDEGLAISFSEAKRLYTGVDGNLEKLREIRRKQLEQLEKRRDQLEAEGFPFLKEEEIDDL